MLNVLIVDDDEDILKSYRIGLKRTGYPITTVHDPVKALEMYRNEGFDIVISDIKMPYMSGIELLKHIKTINKNARVILISAFSDTSEMVGAVQNDIYAFFLKPIDIIELIMTLKDIEDEMNNRFDTHEEDVFDKE